MTTNHTPGPWRRKPRTTIIEDYAGIPTARALRAEIKFPSEVSANVDLIAAAPELLGALVGLLADIARQPNIFGSSEPPSVVAARGAIAKAAGDNT